MKAIVLLALLISLAAASTIQKRPIQKIVGGSITTINQWPMQAALLYSRQATTFSQSCAGTIINNRSILTAAHCIDGDTAAQWRIRVGSSYANSGGTIYNSNSLIAHPSYNRWNSDNDVAIIRSTSNFAFSSNVATGSIAGSNYNLADNTQVWATGWGTTSYGGPSSEQLRQVQIWTINQNTCRTRYSGLGMSITDNMLCSGWLDVGGRDQCQGDSGGPLFHNNIVVGVCSFGWRCAEANYPGVNARVSRFTTWIQNNA